MRDVAFGCRHIVRDTPAHADDFDNFVVTARADMGCAIALPASIGQKRVEIRVPDMPARRLDVSQFDAEFLGTLAYCRRRCNLIIGAYAKRRGRCRYRPLLHGRWFCGDWFRRMWQFVLDRRNRFYLHRAFHLTDVSRGFNLYEHRTNSDDIARLASNLGHDSSDRTFHFDGRFVRHHVRQRLVFRNLVANLYMPCNDFCLGYAFTNIGQVECEYGHKVSPS